MTLTFSDVLILVVLFSCVPLQYVLVKNWGNVESTRSYTINKYLNRLSRFYEDYFVLSSWKAWFAKLLNIKQYPSETAYFVDDEGQSPALEVLQYKQKEGYFAFSQEPRVLRHPDVKFRVGQVIKHKKWNYKGVIVGWDEKARAPVEWLNQMHGNENKNWREMPNYSILVDTKDRLTPQLTYVPQDNLEILTNTQIIHPMLELHFEKFDGDKYVPRPWLRTVYPQD